MYTGHNKKIAKRFQPIKAGAFLAIILIVGLASCAQTPEPVLTEASTTGIQDGDTCPPSVLLQDGPEIFLRTDSRIAVIQAPDQTGGRFRDDIFVSHGEIVVNSLLPAEQWVEVVTPNGFLAQLAGATMIVAYEGDGGQFTVACIDGNCKIGPDAGHLNELPSNSQGSLDKDGTFLGLAAVSLEVLPAACKTILNSDSIVPISTVTNTPEVTATPNATATAACQEFHNQFPLTPTCP